MDGVALIVGVQQFQDSRTLPALTGVLADLRLLKPVFENLGMQVRVLRNMGEMKAKKEAFEKQLDEVLELVKNQKMRHLVLCISTHGSERKNEDSGNVEQYLNMYDDRISLQYILDKLAKCSELENVIKLVMVSACSVNPGNKVNMADPGVEIQLVDDPTEEYQNVGKVMPLTQAAKDQNTSSYIPVLPDNCALWFATTSGRSSYELAGGGTALCQIFISAVNKLLKQSSKVNLMDVVLGVHRETAERVFKKEFKVVPSFVHNLCSEIEFNKPSD